MKRVLLITGTTDIFKKPEDTDNTNQEVFDLTLPSKQKYVQKHGYDLLALRSFGIDKRNIFKPTNIGVLRVLYCFDMLEYYDSVFWIDADSIITNMNYTIDDFKLTDDYSFYASWDWMGKESFSTGNFIVNKTKNTKELFDNFLKIAKYILDQNIWGEEQTALNYLYSTMDKNLIKILEHRFLGSIPDKILFRGIWDGRSDPPFPWSTDSFLAHIGGIPNKNRIDVLKNSFGEYL